MSDGMGREFTYPSSHATNRYFIPNWGKIMHPMAGCKPKMCFGVGRWASIICLRYVPAWHCTLFLSVCGSTPPGGGGCGDAKRADF